MTHSAATIAVTLADELVRQGISDIVVSPGSRSAPLALAVAARQEVRLHVRIDERTAAFLALGLGRAGGRPAVVLCSSGTATANFHPAVLEADAAGVGLLVMTADRPVELRDVGANQTTTQIGLYGGAVRWSHQVGDGGGPYLRSVVARAVIEASGGPRPAGPVHLNVPLREPLLDPEATPLPGAGAVRLPRPPAARSGAYSPMEQFGHDRDEPPVSVIPGPAADAAELLSGRRGLVVAGEGTTDGPEALEAARQLGWPILAEPTSGLRIGQPGLRCGHWLAASQPFADTHVPEVVVVLGRPVLSRPVAALIDRADTIVAVDPAGRGWDPGRNATHVVHDTFAGWIAETGRVAPSPEGWSAAWLDADRVASRLLDERLDEEERPSELGTVRDVARLMPDDGILVAASSLVIRHLNETQPLRELRVVGNRGVSGIDGFVSTAVGVALGHDDPTAAIAGDLSIIHDLTGLVIGVDEPLPNLPIVVLNNDGGGIFDLLPYGEALDEPTFTRLFATPHGLPLEGLAITVGCGYTTLDDLGELSHVLEDAWATEGITLVEVPTDMASETKRHRDLTTAISAALA